MKQVTKLTKLNNLSYFTTATLEQILEIRGDTLLKNIARWKKLGVLSRLKKGVYTTEYYFNKLIDKNSYLEFLANKFRFPSYLSLEYVLSKNGVLSESVFSFTSITIKTTRVYTNKYGVFDYRTISEKLFTGYNIIKKDGFEIAIATKSKALFDYLYLKLYRYENITFNMIENLRLNLDEFSKEEASEFKGYCILSNIKKYKSLPKLLFPNI